MSRRSSRGPLLLVALAFGCSDVNESRTAPTGPEWVHLAEGYRPDDAQVLWLEFPLPRDEFAQLRGSGLWAAAITTAPTDLGATAHAPRLSSGERSFAWHDPAAGSQPPIGSFGLKTRRLLLRLAEGEEPPSGLRLALPAPLGHARGSRWRIEAGEWTSDGFFVPPGGAVAIDADLPADSALRFGTQAYQAGQPSSGATGGARWRVLLDDVAVLEFEQPVGDPRTRWHHVSLPLQRARSGVLSFEVEGPAALYGVQCPVVGPAEVGAAERRPWSDARPDLVIFLADTFRADLLASYGGTWAVTPHLDRFADESLRFERSWAPSTWTLPSQTSLLYGLHPFQHGATAPDRRADDNLLSLAEHLRRQGFRTAAITDALFVSRRYGLDRGFEWFREHEHCDLEQTLADVDEFFAADDGRPSFLFVQTYRTHAPYRVSDEVRARLGDRLDIRHTWSELRKTLLPALLEDLDDQGVLEAGGEEALLQRILREPDWRRTMSRIAVELGYDDLSGEDGLDAIECVYRGYLGCAADLDDGFREFLDLLQRHDRRDHGYVIFTSDHGEHFGEHDLLMHGYGIFEEALRIPLMLQGPGIEAAVSAASASLVDLPRTICTLLEVPPAESWSGRSLIESTAPGAVYAFSCPLQGQSYALVLDPPYKLGGKVNEEARAIGEAEVAFQLEQDPGETKNLLELPGADHHRSSFHRHRGALRASLVPSGAASSVSIDPAERARLAAAGYVIEDESGEEDPEDADESDSSR